MGCRRHPACPPLLPPLRGRCRIQVIDYTRGPRGSIVGPHVASMGPSGPPVGSNPPWPGVKYEEECGWLSGLAERVGFEPTVD